MKVEDEVAPRFAEHQKKDFKKKKAPWLLF